MKTIEEIRVELDCDVYTIEDFSDLIDNGYLISYDGNGYFHNGEQETNISVWDDSYFEGMTPDEIDAFLSKHPYITWYNR